MASSSIKVQGLDQLLKNLEQLPRELVSKNGGLVRTALFKATKRIREQARQRAPRDTGVLAKNIIAVRDKNPRANGASERYIITVRKKRWSKQAKERATRRANGKIDYRRSNDAYYWRWVEFGTATQQAQPFLRPAFESEKEAAVLDFKDSLASGIKRAVAKMRK
ncbi:HK97-gp10 family putative phage morphogenesis protein [Hydrocarboniphaga effusa]|uniref:HK97-gp10 family putative phage morphogenesis protein n=1 Tax=Hydrocarboniphaga effusa TaxID=243629 RepID=UPI003BAC8A15